MCVTEMSLVLVAWHFAVDRIERLILFDSWRRWYSSNVYYIPVCTVTVSLAQAALKDSDSSSTTTVGLFFGEVSGALGVLLIVDIMVGACCIVNSCNENDKQQNCSWSSCVQLDDLFQV